jgi:hypothetical protein
MPAMRVRIRSLAVAIFAAASLAALPATAGADGFPLVGWWPMNEGSGQVVRDWSGHGNNGQLGSTAGADANDPSWIPGVFAGSALRFDGNDFVRIPDSNSLEPSKLTVAAWFRGTSSPGDHKYIVAKGAADCNTGSYGLYTGEGGGVAFYIGTGTGIFDFVRSPEAPASVWDGKWHNAAGTFDGKTVRLFIDGVEVGNGTPTTAAVAYNPPDGGGFIGDYHSDSCDLFLTGDVDGVQIWSTPLPIADIWKFLKTLLTSSR